LEAKILETIREATMTFLFRATLGTLFSKKFFIFLMEISPFFFEKIEIH
jgi:hypothetical protein